MSHGRSLLAVMLVVTLVSSVTLAAVSVNPLGQSPRKTQGSASAYNPGYSSIGSNASTEYLTSVKYPHYSAGVWEGSQIYSTANTPTTSVRYLSNSILGILPNTPTYNGYTLFEPGATVNGGNGTLSDPTNATAYGWISALQQLGFGLTIPKGNWTFNVGLNVSSAGGPKTTGALYLGVAAYKVSVYSGNQTLSFTKLFGSSDKGFNVGVQPVGNYSESFNVSAPRVTFSASQSLFIYYFFNASAYSPYYSFSANFAVGGPGAENYNFTYPDYGWIAGKATPANASVYVGGNPIQTDSNGNFNVSASPATYAITIEYPGYQNYTSEIVVSSGLSTTVVENLSQLFNITFNETGLQPGTSWGVIFNGVQSVSNGSHVTFYAVNGSYNYSVPSVSGYKLLGGNTSLVNVSGKDILLNLSFAQVIYNVDFRQTGIYNATNWSVIIDGNRTYTSAGGADIIAKLANGSYNYSISRVPGYVLGSAATGNLSVNGSDLNISVSFSAYTYGVSFDEQGLPQSMQWSVVVDNLTHSSNSGVLPISLPNGTYNYHVVSPRNYTASAVNGQFSVYGGGTTLNVAFQLLTYKVVFQETGLANGTYWAVNLYNSTGNKTYGSQGKTISIDIPNGSYHYATDIVRNYTTVAGSGNLTVNGVNASANITFRLLTYKLVFRESGLTGNISWSVTLDNEIQTSQSSTITFTVPNGTYTYQISPVNGFKTSSTSSNVTVDGNNNTVPLTFTPLQSGGGRVLSSSTWLFIIVVAALIGLEVITSIMYFRKGRDGKKKPGQDESGNSPSTTSGTGGDLTLTQMLNGKQPAGRPAAQGNGHYISGGTNGNGSGGAFDSAAVPVMTGMTKEQYAEIIESGNSYAVFEPTAQGSMDLFEASIEKQYRGLCFTRQYPERIRQKFAVDGTAVFWLSNIGSENSIRPKDLEKITLQCNEYLGKWKSVILIDGLEYLITNNGFITVLKMLQFLRDSTAVNKSILILSINPSAIGENEVNLIMREVDKVIR